MNADWKRSAGVIAGMVVLVTALIWAGVHNARDRRLGVQRDSAMKVVPAPAADSGSGDMPKFVGKAAPGFSLVDLDGKKVTLAEFKGRPVLVNFWATWCAPCKIEMPWFEEFHRKYGGQGLVILGISADDAGKSVIAGTAKKIGVSYPILLKDDKVEEAYGGVGYLPESFYVDRTGKVMLETAGLTSEEGGKDEIEANLRKLMAVGTP